jgi:hypothetical protein
VLGLGPDILSHVIGAKTHPPRSDTDSAFLIDCIKFAEASIALSEPEHRIRLLSLVLPALVAVLFEGQPSYLVTVREFALAAILRVGPAYPDEFKRIMAAAPQVKASLESAIRAKAAKEAEAASGGRSAAVAPTVPTIQLKMDFSAFK